MKLVNNLNNSSSDDMFYMYVFGFLSILSIQQDVYVFISFYLIKFNNEILISGELWLFYGK
jgi:hypothetical protein